MTSQLLLSKYQAYGVCFNKCPAFIRETALFSYSNSEFWYQIVAGPKKLRDITSSDCWASIILDFIYIAIATMKLFLPSVSIFLATSFPSSYAEGRSLRVGNDLTDEWWNNDRQHHHQRSLQNLDCPEPDTFTSNLSSVRTGQYSSTTGDCFYLYWDPAICHSTSKCPLYVYVDGTANAQGKDNIVLI